MKACSFFLHAQAGGHGEHADIVVRRALGRHKVGQAAARAHERFSIRAVDLVLLGLLAQAVPGQRDLAAGLIGVQRDVVVVHRVGRVQADHRAGAEPAAVDQPLQHRLAVGKHLARLLAHHLVVQDGRVRSGQIPGLEERAPVDEARQLGQVEVPEDPPADELGLRRHIPGPVNRRLVGARLVQRPQHDRLLVGVLGAHALVVGVEFGDIGGAWSDSSPCATLTLREASGT
jgi:hypothetical protein